MTIDPKENVPDEKTIDGTEEETTTDPPAGEELSAGDDEGPEE